MSDLSKFIAQHKEDDLSKLAFRFAKDKMINHSFVLKQISGYQKIRSKIPAWYAIDNLRFPQKLSLEQCSSEVTARYKKEIVEGEALLDLTGGFGVDCAFLSDQFSRVDYVEVQPELCELAKHNFEQLNLKNIQVYNEDGAQFLQKCDVYDCIFLDPARRNNKGEKVVFLSDCQPNVLEILDLLLLKSKEVLIKLSPMIDLSVLEKSFSNKLSEIHVIAVDNECKEILAKISQKDCLEPQIKTVNIEEKKNLRQVLTFSRKEKEHGEAAYASEIEKYLYEPNVAILKAGAFQLVSEKFGLKKIHLHTHLYTSNKLVANFPGRIFEVEKSFSFSKKELKDNLKEVKKANISTRNFPETPESLHKKLKIKTGGDVYLFACTALEKKLLIKTKKITL